MEQRYGQNRSSASSGRRRSCAGDHAAILQIKKDRPFSRKFTVYGKNQVPVFFVRPRHIAATKTLEVYDASDHSVAKIKQCISLIVPKYRIEMENGEKLTVTRKFSLFPEYLIKGAPWSVLGDISSFRYKVFDRDNSTLFDIQRVASRKSIGYEVTCLDKGLQLEGVCVALAIDAAVKAVRNSGR